MNATPFDVIKKVAANLQQPPPPRSPTARLQRLSPLAQRLSQRPETPEEIGALVSALHYLSPDARRGNGRLFDEQGQPVDDYWLGCIWAIRRLNWSVGEQIAREWSKGITRCAYSEEGFQEAWLSYDPTHANPVTIRSLYKLARLQGWNEAKSEPSSNQTADQEDKPSRYQLLGRDEIAKLPPSGWRVKLILPETGVAAIFGPSASGKSFLAFDLAASIAAGEPWFGAKTKQSNVVYIMLEGEAGLQNRMKAWEAARGRVLPPALQMILQPLDLMTSLDTTDLLKVLPHDAVIFIDTLNRASPTADENKSQDMGQIISQCKLLSAETRGLVILVHHTGKDTTRGLRGHSSLIAALDGAIEVTRDGTGNRAWSEAKIKDSEDGNSHRFRLQVHTLGKDADGDPITSCSVERDTSAIFAPPKPQGKNQQAALDAVKAELSRSTITGKAGSLTSRCMEVEAAIKVVASKLATVAANKRTNRARKLVQDLIMGGFLKTGLEGDDGWVWLT